MKEVLKKYEVFTYDELNEEVKEKLLSTQINDEVESYCESFLNEDLKEKAKELLQKYFGSKAIFKDIYYDLSHSQGSGAMIAFELQYYNKNLNIIQSGFYYHELSFKIQYADYNYLTDKQEKKLTEKIYCMNRELSKYGYELIDYKNFIDYAIERLQEFSFLKDGTIFE